MVEDFCFEATIYPISFLLGLTSANRSFFSTKLTDTCLYHPGTDSGHFLQLGAGSMSTGPLQF
jgi:hypothetical protein